MSKDNNFQGLVWDHHFESGKELRPGSLLISEPFMSDPNFKKTVILLCEHSREDGTMGFVLNKPLNLTIGEVLDELEICQHELFYGGPLQEDTLHFVHRLGNLIPDSVKIGDDLYWGGNFEVLAKLMKDCKIPKEDIRFFLGYSGWAYDQLMEELQEDSWVIHQATPKMIFDLHYGNMWQQILKQMGLTYRLLSNYPENPSYN